jgi:hypothetical protein
MISEAPVVDKNLYSDDQELTTLECAAVAELNRRTIVAWIQRGDLPATQRPGKRGHYRVLWHDLYAALNRRVVPKDADF